MKEQQRSFPFGAEFYRPAKPRRGRYLQFFELVARMADRPAGCFASYEWFARKFLVSVRTIKAWVRKLKDMGRLTVILRGPTSAVLKVIAACGKLAQRCGNLSSSPPVSSPQTSPLLGPSLLNPSGIDSTSLAAPPRLPLSKRILRALARGARRIAAATNPAAYRQSIINRERAQEEAQRSQRSSDAQFWRNEARRKRDENTFDLGEQLWKLNLV